MAEEEKTEEAAPQAENPAGASQQVAKTPKKKRPRKRTSKSSQGTIQARKREDGVSVNPKTLLGGVIALVILYVIYTYGIGSNQVVSKVNSSYDEFPTNVVVLNDQRCGKDCDLSRLIAQVRNILPNLNVKELDIGSTEGKRLYQDTGIILLPALFFENSITTSKAYPTLSKYLDSKGQYYSMRIGANWDPYCDPTTEHCGEVRCKERIGCRPETPKTLDVFVMSQCPYGIQALNSMKEVLSAFDGEISFDVRYIGQVDPQGNIISLHGAAEVDEDLRGVCAEKLYPDNYTYLSYIWCRNNDTKGNWTKCAEQAGMDAANIKACAEGPNGREYLKESFAEADQLAIYSSPTFFVNNKRLFNAVTAADIQSGICGANKGLKGCQETLGNVSNIPQGSCG